MAANKGNQFWKKRSKHGRDKIIESPEIMLEAIYEFLEQKTDEKIHKPEAIKSGDNAGTQFDLKIKDYPTLSELAHFLGFKTLKSWYNYKDYEGFLQVITHAEEIIKTWKLKGAAVNVYNHSIVARDLQLADKKDIVIDDKIELKTFNAKDLLKKNVEE